MKRIKYIALILIALLATACRHKEFCVLPPDTPAVNAEISFLLRLDLSEMELHAIVNYDINGQADRSRSAVSHAARYIVETYRADAFGGDRSPSPLDRVAVSFDDLPETGIQALDYKCRLTPGAYRFIVWCDRSDSDTPLDDKYYDTSDLAKIVIRDLETDSYRGHNQMRLVFRGEANAYVDAEGKVRLESPDAEPITTIVVDLIRPMGRYIVQSTDLDEFITSRAKSLGADAPAVSDPAAFLSNYHTVIRYKGTVPTQFNAHLDQPWGASLGVTNHHEPEYVDEGYAELGGDHIFVDGETSVDAVIEVYDKDNNLVSSSSTVRIPLKRGKKTIVKGRFLTSQSAGGVGINPDFDGSFEIII